MEDKLFGCILGLAVMLIAAYTDYKKAKIYNVVVIPAVLIYCGYLFVSSHYSIMDSRFIVSIKWCLMSWAVTFIPIILDLMRGGDGKLVAFAGLILCQDIIVMLIYFLLIAFIWFVINDAKENKSLVKTLGSLIFCKNFSNKARRYNLGGLFICIAFIITILRSGLVV